MRQFHPLKVAAKRNETRDSVRVALEVPEELQATFSFLPGQHLPVRVDRDGTSLRRTYSICSSPGSFPLEIGVRIQPGGAFSEYADKDLKVGDTLEVMPPFGQFHADIDAAAEKFYLGFAAGSGITPIMSIMSAVLESEPNSRFALFYGNRRQTTTMFIDDLYALKNRYPGRVQLQFVFSREDQEFPIAAGRLDADKVREVYDAFCTGTHPDEAFVCGPDSMIDDVSSSLEALGMPADRVHSERFGAPREGGESGDAEAIASGAVVTVIMDGQKKTFDMAEGDPNIVDAAAEHGIDLPYSCKGGVCATCRCHVREGEVTMAVNYGLEPWEIEQGYVLACQSRPITGTVTIDYDKT